MKKMYILLLTAAHTASVSCMMESELTQRRLLTGHYNSDSMSIPLQTFTPQQPQYICTANQPGWEQLNYIAYAPYKSDQPTVQDPTKNLFPIYTPIVQITNTASTQKSIKKQEEKPLLRTITPVQPDNDLMQKLYNHVYTFVKQPRKLSQNSRDQDLASLILTINKERINGINEDIMGKFAHAQPDYSYYPITVLFFSFLKKYRLTTNETQEPLPFGTGKLNVHKNNLIQVFDSSSDIDNAYTIFDYNDLSFNMQKYPAFVYLQRMLRHMFESAWIVTVEQCSTYLYSNEKIVIQNCSEGSYTDLQSEFYSKAYNLFLITHSSPDNIYDLLQIIETAKNKHHIKNETELGYSILYFEPTKITTITNTMYQMYNYGNEKFSPNNAKKRISLFCKLVEKYNHARKTKKSPTGKQYHVDRVIQMCNLPLPDSFNNELLDEKQYAFVEFHQLFQNTKALMWADEQQVQQCVDKLYPQKK